jgi:DNA modification methylase
MVKKENIDFIIEELKTVNNPNSIHGIYPYRGKISALDADQILKQIPKNSVVLDPFCGSGTIVYEGLKYGHKTIGTDLNPIAVFLANGKINIPDSLSKVQKEVEILIIKAKELKTYRKINNSASKHFDENTIDEIARISFFFDSMSEYVKACFLGSICLTARGCNHYMWTSSTVGKDINPKRYIDFYEKFSQKVKKHYYPIKNKSVVYDLDARKLSEKIKLNSVDYVFTSPPYFDCLDYTAYYAKIIYDILEFDRDKIKVGLIQTFKEYEDDMRIVLQELYKVCKKGSKIIFVVGDKKIHGKLINGGEFFNSISPFKKVQFLERTYSGTSSQVFDKLNNTKRKEQIIIWEK